MKITVESPKNKKGIKILFENKDVTGLNAIFIDNETVYLVFGKVAMSLSPEEYMDLVGNVTSKLPEISKHFDIVPHIKGLNNGVKN